MDQLNSELSALNETLFRARTHKDETLAVLRSPELTDIIAEYEKGTRNRDFPLTKTFEILFGQVLNGNTPLRAALLQHNTSLIGCNEEPLSTHTGGLSLARSRLPEKLPVDVARYLAKLALQYEEPSLSFHGRKVKTVDGTTITMADTPANQKEYPQTASQEEGLGQPIARVLAVFSQGTGACIDIAMSSYTGKQTGELALLRTLMHNFEKGDIALGDALYGRYFNVALLKKRKVDVVFHWDGTRTIDFRKGQQIGEKDHIVTWDRPKRPEWMDEETYETFPKYNENAGISSDFK
jgi:hypothetical protein